MTLNEVEGTEPATAMEMPAAPVTAEAEIPAETGDPADTPAKATTEDIAPILSGAVSVESAAVPAETNGSAAGTAAQTGGVTDGAADAWSTAEATAPEMTSVEPAAPEAISREPAAPEAISAQASGATGAEVAVASASALAGVSAEEAEAAPAAEEAVEAEPAQDAAPVQATAPPAETSQAEAAVEAAAAPAETEAAPTEWASAGAEDVLEAAPVEAAVAPAAAAPAAAEAAAAPASAPLAEPPAPAAAPVAPRPEPTTMEELLSEQSGEIRSLKHGDVVEGSVVRIDKDEILVDIGAKSEGVVSNRELYGRNAESQPQLNIGDVVLVYVLQPESNEGHAVLSLRRAGLERKWRAMQEQLDAGAIIEAPVIDHNKGGLIVDCGIRGFVPISQIVDFPRRPQNEQPRDAAQEIAEKLQPYVGRKLRLKILEVNRKANRLILSEKVALYEERREKRDELFSSLKVSQHVKGTVRSIAPFGVFVDLGGIDGLVHKSELSWNKVNNPESGYRVGEEVEAEVIDINHERGRISLSIRRLQPDPWHSTVADLKVGDVIEGTVTKIVNFGAFVRVREGLEGLIHISELSQARVAHPGDVVHEGQKLRLKVISLDSERHRLGLSLKQAEEAPPRPAAPEPRERRGRPERSYDMSQAVQEPEGGIDNTLAAAFAQVRQQMAEQDRAASQDSTHDEDAGAAAETTASAPASDREVEAAAETAAAVAVGVEAIAAAEAESVVETELAAEIVELAVAEDAAEAEVEALAADMTEAEANEVRAELAGVEAAAESELKARIEAASEAESEIEAEVAADAEALAGVGPGVAEASVSVAEDVADRPVVQHEADSESAG